MKFLDSLQPLGLLAASTQVQPRLLAKTLFNQYPIRLMADDWPEQKATQFGARPVRSAGMIRLVALSSGISRLILIVFHK